jgi:hypothetical protein
MPLDFQQSVTPSEMKAMNDIASGAIPRSTSDKSEFALGKTISRLGDEIASTNVRQMGNTFLSGALMYYLYDVMNIDEMVVTGREGNIERALKASGVALGINWAGSKARAMIPQLAVF